MFTREKFDSNLVLIERVDVSPFSAEIINFLKENHWNFFRSKNNSVQRETKSISLKVPAKYSVRLNDVYSFHNQFTAKTKQSKVFLRTLSFINDFARSRFGIVGRVIVVNLCLGGKVYPHVDCGDYYTIRDRYHLVIASEGSLMISGSEKKEFKTGDLFYFNNHCIHEAVNYSNSDRIHIIFDVLPLRLDSIFFTLFSIAKTLFLNICKYLGIFNSLVVRESLSIERNSTLFKERF